MATAFGKGEDLAFDESEECFEAYLERLEQFFVANDLKIDDGRARAVFLTVVGKKNHTLLMDLCAPSKPAEKKLQELIELMRTHFVPKTNFIAERYKFNTRNQREDESISEYMAKLRKLAATCKFGTFLDDALRDRFVCGVKSAELRDRLLNSSHTKDLSLAAAYDMGLAYEVAKQNAQQWSQKSYKANAISRTSPVKKDERGKPCYRCAGQGHLPSECRFKDVDCRLCKKKGHIAKACRSQNQEKKDKPTKWTKHMDARMQLRNSKEHDEVDKSWTKQTRPPEEQPAQVKTSEKERPIKPADSQPQALKETAEPKSGFVEEYRAGNISDVELFSVKADGEDIDSESDTVKPYYVYLRVNDKRLKMEVDTGAAVSVISESLYKRRFRKQKLMPSNCILRTYSKQSLSLKGSISVTVKCNKITCVLPLLVVEGNGPALLGRDWIKMLKLDWSCVNRVAPQSFEELCDKYPEVFEPSLGKVKGIKAKLHVLPGAIPKFCKSRPVPYALREAVEVQLGKMEADGVITPVSYSEWAAPTVNIPKMDQTVRICGDYKVSINPWLEVDQYPIPKPRDLFTKLAGGERFTKLDLSQAYQQVELEDSSKQYLTINTHKGLYQVNRLPYGVASTPAIFQKLMDQVLQGMDGVICYLDDILITGKDNDTHLIHLEEVLKRLKNHNLKVKREKCAFFQHSVSYLGHVIDAEGIHPIQEKCEAIANVAMPTNTTELKSFLSLLSYYGKFIPNLSTIISPMTGLLQKDVKWVWSESCQKAFETAKKQLLSSKVLVHYNPDLPLILACDASPVGIGAVISHKMTDGSEKPIIFASRMLTKAEKNYSQIEKEALGLIFGVIKFHEYLFGHMFTLVTDHKPLLKILGPKTGVPPLAAARMQRWALILAAYTYEIQYKPSGQHGNVDALSRLPIADKSFPESNPIFRNMYAYPVLRQTPQGQLLMGPTEEANRSEVAGAVRDRARCKEEVLSEATAFVRQNGGDAGDQFLVLAHCRIQFGKHQGQRFLWLLENSLGYAVYLVCSSMGEEERDNPLSASKHLFLSYTSRIREVGEAVEVYQKKQAMRQEAQRTGDTGCLMIEFGDFKGRSMKEVYEDPSKEAQALISYLKKAKARPNTNMALFQAYVLKRQAPAQCPHHCCLCSTCCHSEQATAGCLCEGPVGSWDTSVCFTAGKEANESSQTL
ncbi:uncharacterized protein LOC130904346 [Corythoichthys intestinalis]|uniref:uncharacterized protein LOC130904346 n=1 Tax=Corythoichthys intestinalis TaxID=161448 RepID=UPI0025A56752|nr:uncharacterized protein LOC130904346 [Corythoichthys intestinalis]